MRSVGSLFQAEVRQVRSLAGAWWTCLKSFFVWCYGWWYGENCLRTRFKKLKQPFKNKTSDKGLEDENADIEAARLALKPDKDKGKRKAIESISPARAPRIAKATDKAVTRRSEIPTNLFDAEHAKYLGQEETDFQRGPGLRGSVGGNGAYRPKARCRPPTQSHPPDSLPSQPSLSKSSILQVPPIVVTQVGPVHHNEGPRQPLNRVDSGAPTCYHSTYLQQLRDNDERIADVNANRKRFKPAARSLNTGEGLTTYEAVRLHTQVPERNPQDDELATRYNGELINKATTQATRQGLVTSKSNLQSAFKGTRQPLLAKSSSAPTIKVTETEIDRSLTTSKSNLQSAIKRTRQTLASVLTASKSIQTIRVTETENDQTPAKESRKEYKRLPSKLSRVTFADIDEDITLLNSEVFDEIPLR